MVTTESLSSRPSDAADDLPRQGGTAHELMGLDGMGEIASDCIITIYARRILLD